MLKLWLLIKKHLKDDNGKSEQTSEAKCVIKKLWKDFEVNMSDDLNSPPILRGAFQSTMKFINVSITKLKKTQQGQQEKMALVVSLLEIEKAARGILDVLGLLTPLSYAEFLKEMKQKALAKAQLGEEEVLQNIEERKMRRKVSDNIRGSLKSRGISLMDIPGKDTLWRPSFECSSQPIPRKATLWRPWLLYTSKYKFH
ncbi:unnamed protein product [Eruca vesicaria subsp. sativa]|uniref:Uncharacterized protein n=1 Tax=Eruca vesicaria subsp. sativa TaxID=29727 RepID=A0ABC8KXG4_ERUVS|nr:unnamed protein product [Eruca vesicaria subsp. sativa]